MNKVVILVVLLAAVMISGCATDGTGSASDQQEAPPSHQRCH